MATRQSKALCLQSPSTQSLDTPTSTFPEFETFGCTYSFLPLTTHQVLHFLIFCRFSESHYRLADLIEESVVKGVEDEAGEDGIYSAIIDWEEPFQFSLRR